MTGFALYGSKVPAGRVLLLIGPPDASFIDRNAGAPYVK
jgi:hypothetical protein